MKGSHAAFLGLLMVLFVLPLGVLALYALSPGWSYPQVIPERLGGQALAWVWRYRSEVATSLLGSLAYSFLTVGATFAICLFPAQVFAREEFRFKTVLEGMLLAPALVPAMTFSMGVHFAFIRLRIADTMFGVVAVLTIFSYPYMLRALVDGIKSYGGEYDRCAANLGAGPLMRMFRVELPLLLPAALAGGTVVFLVAFSEYFLVFLIGGGKVASFSGYLFPLLTSSNRGAASLLTLIFTVVPIILFIIVETTVKRLYRRRGLV